eukprot:658625-Hanusia_phi.AAC.4
MVLTRSLSSSLLTTHSASPPLLSLSSRYTDTIHRRPTPSGSSRRGHAGECRAMTADSRRKRLVGSPSTCHLAMLAVLRRAWREEAPPHDVQPPGIRHQRRNDERVAEEAEQLLVVLVLRLLDRVDLAARHGLSKSPSDLAAGRQILQRLDRRVLLLRRVLEVCHELREPRLQGLDARRQVGDLGCHLLPLLAADVKLVLLGLDLLVDVKHADDVAHPRLEPRHHRRILRVLLEDGQDEILLLHHPHGIRVGILDIEACEEVEEGVNLGEHLLDLLPHQHLHLRQRLSSLRQEDRERARDGQQTLRGARDASQLRQVREVQLVQARLSLFEQWGGKVDSQLEVGLQLRQDLAQRLLLLLVLHQHRPLLVQQRRLLPDLCQQSVGDDLLLLHHLLLVFDDRLQLHLGAARHLAELSQLRAPLLVHPGEGEIVPDERSNRLRRQLPAVLVWRVSERELSERLLLLVVSCRLARCMMHERHVPRRLQRQLLVRVLVHDAL